MPGWRSRNCARRPRKKVSNEATEDQTGSVRTQVLPRHALDDGVIIDAVLAKSSSGAGAIWALREEGVAETARHGTVVLFDISLKIGDMEDYVGAIESALKARFGAKTGVWIYGHLGDGNLHININVHSGEPANEVRHAVEDIVYAPSRL